MARLMEQRWTGHNRTTQSLLAAEVMNQILSFSVQLIKCYMDRSCSLIAGYKIVQKTITEVEKLRNAFEFKKIVEKLPSDLSKPVFPNLF